MTINVNMQATTNLSISERTLSARSQAPSAIVEASPYLLGSYSGSNRYTITADIRGSLNSDGSGLILQFSSEPQLSTNQILAALGGQEVQDIGSGDVDTGAASLIAKVLSNRLGASIFDNLYNATGLDINVDLNPGSPLDVNFTQRLSSRMDATFQRLDTSRSAGVVDSTLSPPQYLVTVGYNLSNRIRFSLSTDDQRSYGMAIEGVFRF
jgi:hypothetical protein